MEWNLFALIMVAYLLSVQFTPFGHSMDGLQIQMNWGGPPAIVLAHYKEGMRKGMYALMVYTDSFQCDPFALILDNGTFRIQKRINWK